MGKYERTINLIGHDAFYKLSKKRVLIVGVGGVGSYAAEAVARSGIGEITLMDGDVVEESNLNRQLVALGSTIGVNKAIVMAERIKDIDSEKKVCALNRFYEKDDRLDLEKYDFIIDAIDKIEAKIALIENATKAGTRIISSMGAGGKIQNECFRVADISKTHTCPLAKIVRKELRERGIYHLPVVFSDEKPVKSSGTIGTLSYVPATAGLIIAGYVIRELMG